MTKHGFDPFLECSSRGDKRFSAFYARLKSFGGKSIEEIYQGAKVFQDGSTGLGCKEAKGRKAVNQEEVSLLYDFLWLVYLIENPELKIELLRYNGLQDMFGQRGHCCQATSLWSLRDVIL